MENQENKSPDSKIARWLKDPYNLAFLGILLLSIILRVYYFSITKNQALWWDEAEYGLKAKAFAFGTPATGWAAERELIIPFLFSIILKLGGTETTLRIIQILVSLATIILTYTVISKISSKKVGLISSFGMSVFWLHIFFSMRVLLYLWAPLIFLGIINFFYEGYIKDNKKSLIAFGILSAIGLMTYFSVGFLLFGIFIFILFTEKISFLKSKKAWKAFLIFFLTLLPFMIYFQITYGFPIPRLAVGFRATTQEAGAGISGMLSYVSMFPSRVGIVFTILSLIGILIFLGELSVGIGVKDHLNKHKNWFLLFICFFVPLLMYTLYGVIGGSGTFYDAFILPVFPFAFAFAALSLEKIQSFSSKYGKNVALIIILVLLVSHAYFGIKNSDSSIKNKISSYDSVKYGGVWIKENSQQGSKVVSASVPQMTYYSERETFRFSESSSEFEEFVKNEKPEYLVDSVWESRRPWLDDYFSQNKNNLVMSQIYFFDAEQTQPSLIIYKTNF